MELKMINMKDIVTNPLQPRQEFNREKLQELADSIREGELLQPIVVRKQKDKFEIVAGERRFKSFQILKEPKIPSIILDIKDDTDAILKGAVENWQREDLTSIERENTIGTLVESSKFKNKEEIARKLGVGTRTVYMYYDAYKDRKNFAAPAKISTTTLYETETLSDEPRKKVLKQIEQGKIKTQNIKEVVDKVKEFPEPEQQMEILEEFEEQEETSKEIFNDIVQKKKEIVEGTREPEHYVKIESDNDKRTIEDYYNIKSKIYDIVAIHIQYMKTKELQDEATQILWDIYKYAEKELTALGRIQGVVDA